MRMAKANNGFVSAADAASEGINPRVLSSAVARGLLTRVDRGLYCLPEAWEDEYVVAQHRFVRGVFSHDTALYLLSLSDQAPERLTMTFPLGYNPTSAKRFGLVAKTSPSGLHELGTTILKTPYGNAVRAYDAERTLCDMLRGTSNPDVQRLNPAFRAYLSSEGRSVPKLLEYAGSLGVKGKVRRYLEVLL